MATEKEDLEADTAKHSSILEAAVSRSILQCTVEQVLDVPVPEMVEVPKTVSHDGIQQQTAEQIVDVPVPMEVSKDLAQDRVQRRFAEQTIDNPVIRCEDH